VTFPEQEWVLLENYPQLTLTPAANREVEETAGLVKFI
jgi:hypothetical protein